MSKQTKNTTENKPPEWSKPLFEQSASEAQNIYNSGSGGGVYQGNTVADLGQTTQGGIQGVTDAAQNWSNPGYQNMLTAPTSAGSNLSGMASGQNLLSNPHFEDALSGQLDKTANQVQSQFSGAGRYGSGANTGALTSELGNIRSNALFNQYNADTQNMLTANSQIDSANTNRIGQMQNSFNNQLGASQAQIGAGQVQDQNEQAKLQADYSKWLATDMQDWTRLGLLQSAAAGSAGNYGTGVQTQTQPFNVMGGIGALGQLAMKSDARLKENIRRVGVLDNGLPVYVYKYKWGGPTVIGVMAQDLMEFNPSAVIMESDGFMAVNYDKAVEHADR